MRSTNYKNQAGRFLKYSGALTVALAAACVTVLGLLNQASAAACTESAVNRSLELKEFCINVAKVDGYIRSFRSQYPETPLPEEAQNALNLFSTIKFDEGVAKTPVSLLLDFVGKVDQLINDKELLRVKSVYTALRALTKKINETALPLTQEDFLDRVALLQVLVSDAQRSALFKTDPILTPTKTLWGGLGPLLHTNKELLSNVKGHADETATMVKMAWRPLVDAGIKEITAQERSAAITSLKALRGEIDNVTAPLTPRVHIYYAFYGDVRSFAASNRICDATSAVRKACEAKPNCSLPTGFRTSLCGYDPAPYVEDRDRGAIIAFDCQVGDQDLWTRNATTSHGTFLSKKLPQPVVIQSTEMEIACAKIPN